MTDVTIRRATVDDADAIADLVDAAEPDLLVSEIPRDVRRDRIGAYIAQGDAWFVAVAGDRVVGELALALGGPEPARIGFGVARPWRRRGIGRRLLEHGIEWSRANEVHKLTAEVFPHNTAALSLLHAAGFTEEAYLVNHFKRRSGGAYDAVLLTFAPTA